MTHLVVVVHTGEVLPALVPSDLDQSLSNTNKGLCYSVLNRDN